MFEEMTFENILKRMLDRIPNSMDKRQGSIIYDALAPAAVELTQAYITLDYIYSKLDANNLHDEELELFVNQRTGIERKKATKAIRKGIFSKTDSSPLNVPIGSRFTGEDLYYKVTKKIADGEFEVECEESGESGNAYIGTLIPVAYINGLGKAELVDMLTPGYEAESDESLLERYYERIRTPATSGNKYHYLNWAKEVPGVGDARVISLWAGDNTVKVVIIDSNKQPADQGLVDMVQKYIDPESMGLGEGQAPIGAFCTVASATPKEINVSVFVSKEAEYSIEQVKSNIEEGIANYFKSIAFKKNMVSYAQVGSIILDSDGVLDYRDLRMNDGIENISIGNEEVAIIGQVVIDE